MARCYDNVSQCARSNDGIKPSQGKRLKVETISLFDVFTKSLHRDLLRILLSSKGCRGLNAKLKSKKRRYSCSDLLNRNTNFLVLFDYLGIVMPLKPNGELESISSPIICSCSSLLIVYSSLSGSSLVVASSVVGSDVAAGSAPFCACISLTDSFLKSNSILSAL